MASGVKKTLSDRKRSNTQPFTDAHAIVWMDVGISFSEQLGQPDLEALCGRVRSSMLDEDFVESSDGCDGDDGLVLNFERLDDDGEAVEVVHVHNTHVHYVTHEYRGWSVSRDVAISRLANCFDFMVERGDLNARLTLAFEDAFIAQDPKKYRASDVFSPNSYLPKTVLDGRTQWRMQLTLDEKNSQPKSRDWSKVFSRLTVNARVVDMASESVDEELRHLTTVLHRQQIVVHASVGARVAWSAESVRRRLDVMHSQNKSLMKELLSEDMKSLIGLSEVSYEL